MMELIGQLAEHARHRSEGAAYREVIAGGKAGCSLNYRSLWEAAEQLGKQLRQQAGGGQTVVIRIGNTCDYPIAFLGILMAGCAAFPVALDIAGPELQAVIKQSQAWGVIGEGLTIETTGRKSTEHRVGLLLQSSGTTGRPKIVYRPAAAVDAVCRNMVQAIGFKQSDRVLATVPLCHSYGLEHGLLAPIYAGAEVHLCRGFDFNLVLGQLTAEGITIFPAVPSMFEMLANLADSGTRFPALRRIYSAGGPLPGQIWESLRHKYNIQVSQLYGASEIGSVTFGSVEEDGFDPASVGCGMPGVNIRIAATGNPMANLPAGEEGEVMIRATSMFAGYLLGDSGVTTDGFFATGDLGRLDARGNLTVTGRIKLLIDVGGLKVNPLEIEDAMGQHPQVAACVVVPVRLSETISRVKAVIRLHNAAVPPSIEELRQFARARLTPHKVPRLFEFREALPTSSTGKILRHLVEA